MTKTLRQHLEAFGVRRSSKAPTPPTEEVLGRERAFRDQADKIEKLRQQRLSSKVRVYEIVRHRGQWRILHQQKHSRPFVDQEAALDAAKRIAAETAEAGHSVRIVVRQADGQVASCSSTDE